MMLEEIRFIVIGVIPYLYGVEVEYSALVCYHNCSRVCIGIVISCIHSCPIISVLES